MRTDTVLVSVALAVVLATVPACQAPPPPAPAPVETNDPFADRADVVAVHETLLAAMEAGDGPGVAALLDSAHDILMFHPAVETRFDGADAIADGIGRMLGKNSPVEITEVHLQVWVDGDVAWLTSHLLLESPSVTDPFAARGTEIWRRTEDGWRLGHAHWSGQPSD
jgi:ketosteroid isomerase-like protein